MGEVGSRYDITINKYAKGVNSWVSVEVGDSVGWSDDRGVGVWVDISDGNIFVLDDKSRFSLIDESLEKWLNFTLFIWYW